MENYLGTTARAAIIRQELKAKHKLSSRDVSVKARHYSMGSSIDITIKNPAVALQLVKEVAAPHESIDRDASGEILSGGNRFLHVGYSSEAREAMAAAQLPAVSEAAALLSTADDGRLFPIAGTGFLLGSGRHAGFGFSLWSAGPVGSHVAEVGDLKEAAILVAMGGRR